MDENNDDFLSAIIDIGKIYNNKPHEEIDKLHSLDIIFTNLDFISNIKCGEKISFDDKYLLVENSWVPSLTRMIYGTNRASCLNFMWQTVKHGFKHYEKLTTSNNEFSEIMGAKLITKIKKCVEGLVKYRQSYADDDKIKQTVDLLIDKILKKTI